MKSSWLYGNLKFYLFIKLYMIETADCSESPEVKAPTNADANESESMEGFTFKSSGINRKVLVPPHECRGMKKIDKDLFAKSVSVPCLTTFVGNIGRMKNVYHKYLIHLEHFKPVQPFFDENGKIDDKKKTIVLDPDVVSSFDTFSDEEKNEMEKYGVTEKDFRFGSIDIGYENWYLDDLIKAVLPEDKRVSGFSVIGHIVQLNLRESLLEYKYAIGQILLDKVKRIRTVINKLSLIDDDFRFFKMELLCGDNDMEVVVKENYCFYELNFEKVYWNSRLGTEHDRLVRKMRYSDVLYDVCCGVGPFSVLAAKKGCSVLANDLNPTAVSYLQKNLARNKVEDKVKTFNLDGNVFIKSALKKHILAHNTDNYEKFKTHNAHIVINLPNTAHLLLKSFIGLFTLKEFVSIQFHIYLHVYVFVKGDSKNLLEMKREAVKLLEKNFGGVQLINNIIEVFDVRHVAPKKDMFRVSLRLEKEVLVARSKRQHESSDTYEDS